MTGGGGLKLGNQNATSNTPPTPSFQKLNQSVGPNRAPSPQGKKPPRTSLPRPDSPVRRLQLNPPPRPSLATPGPATNGAGAGAAAAKTPARYGSPTTSKFAQSVRGTTGDPSKRPAYGERKDSLSGPRSASALGQSSSYDDEDATPTGPGAAAIRRSRTTNGNGGSVGSVSSFNLKMRPASRANEEEIERLRAQLEDRDRQLREQASTLAEMESSLTELQTLMEQADGPGGGLSRLRRGSAADSDQQQPRDVATLRALLREKNDKIAMLTAEFDAHRADFRSTIDTLEMASTETQNLYEKRIAELEQEVRELAERTEDVDSVAQQLKQLEELVQELEEGLEDARRGEAEARGEVEFLRGEVERTRAELRREREKAANGGAAMANGNAGGGLTNGDHRSSASISKELEQKEDEIRGLKAIIHSFTRDSVPESPDKTPRHGADKRASESLDSRMARERLEREVAELRALLESKTAREEELEREIEQLRRASGGAGVFGGKNRGSTASMNLGAGERSSLRDSRGTVILAPRPGDHHGSRSPEAPAHRQGRERGRTLDTMAESDAYSTATETSTLWCEICETSGHDILTCTNMFGPQQGQQTAAPAVAKNGATSGKADSPTVGSLGVTTTNGGLYQNGGLGDVPKPAPLSPIKKQPAAAPQAQEPPRHPPSPDYTQPRPLPVSSSATTTTTVRILPNPMDSGPVAGKDSGIVDGAKWCALCERDGHDSVDCPFEDAF